MASDNASAAMFDLSKRLIFKDMSDAEKSKSADAGAVKCQLFSLFGYIFLGAIIIQMGEHPKIAFELSALWRLVSWSANHNEILLPEGTTFVGLRADNTSKLFLTSAKI